MRETHEIHTSERRSYACRLRWDWEFRKHLKPNVGIKPLEFGIAFHIAMQTFYEPTRWYSTTPREKFVLAFAELQKCIEEQRHQFLVATNQLHIKEPMLGNDYDERIELAHGMLRHYALKVHPTEDKWFEPVKVEIPFRVPIYDPDDLTEPIYCDSSPGCGQNHPNPAPITYDGRVDMIIRDLVHGGLWAWDHKTASSLTSNDWFFQMDDQITSYVMALSLMMNLDIKGFIYAEILKNFPKPLEPLSKRYQGRLLSTDKRRLTDYDTAYKCIMDHDKDGYVNGAYDEYLDFLSSDDAPKFVRRFPIVQPKKKLAVAASDIGRQALDMVDPDIRISPIRQKAVCNYCQFREPCLGRLEGEDYRETLRTLFHIEEPE